MLAETQNHVAELDAGPRARAAGSERLCAATGSVKPVAEMIRFVVSPDGAAVPDLKRKLPGRGLWITATRQALAEAVKRRAFARGFKRDIRVTDDIIGMTEGLIERAALDALAIAHKAGKVAIGFGKAEAALAREPVVGLIHAASAAPDGSRKLNAALGRRFGQEQPSGIAPIEAFTSAQLDLAFGRSNVIHAALLAGPESETFLARLGRLERFRTGVSGEPGHHKPALKAP
jgi:predicted RNA-binding protein YlxR (DUF448 family)